LSEVVGSVLRGGIFHILRGGLKFEVMPLNSIRYLAATSSSTLLTTDPALPEILAIECCGRESISPQPPYS